MKLLSVQPPEKLKIIIYKDYHMIAVFLFQILLFARLTDEHNLKGT